MSFVYHGDKIVLRGTYMNGNSGLVKKHEWIAYISWNPNENIEEGIEFIIGDKSRKGDIIKVDEPVLLEYNGKKLVGKSLLGYSLLTSRDGDGKVIFRSTVKGGLRTDRVYTLFYGKKRIGRNNHDMFSGLDLSEDSWSLLFGIEKTEQTILEPPPAEIKKKIKGVMLVDDGPSKWSVKWLRWCEKNNCHFGMMLNGLQASKYPELVDEFTKSPVCTWGVHTKTHKNAVTQLSVDEFREEILYTLDQIKASYKRCNMEYKPVKLYRFPYTDSGSGLKHQELQGVLQEFGFDVTPDIRKAQWESKRRDCVGIFVNDSKYQGNMWQNPPPDKSIGDYIEYMENMYNEIKGVYDSKWIYLGIELFGCHCGSMTIETFKFWMSKGFSFENV